MAIRINMDSADMEIVKPKVSKTVELPKKVYKATFNNMPNLPYAVDEALNRLRINMEFM